VGGQPLKDGGPMPAYIIANIELHDAERYKDYIKHVPALIEKSGGKYLVRGGRSQVLEGSWSPSGLIILEFPDREAALALYNHPEYQPYKNLRQSISTSSLIVVDGHE
jgi:uncharacterized protein (DUF1330 family)